jgi:hypothetical protein
VAHDTCDALVDFVRSWSDKTEIAMKRFIPWIGDQSRPAESTASVDSFLGNLETISVQEWTAAVAPKQKVP